jgi:flagellar basal-body rod protein FlgG
VATSRQFSQGNLQQTSNYMDVAIKGNGFFPVTMPDGTTGYTRDGSFQLDNQGKLVTNNGYEIQPGITVPANATSVTIAPDGTVTAAISGQTTAQTLGQIQLTSFINPAGLEPRGENLYTETPASGTPQTANPGTDSTGTLAQGFVETSNVNVVEELITMIQTQRAYELNSKAIQTSDQMLQRLAQL